MEGQGGVEEVGRGEEEAYCGYCRYGAGEAGGKPCGAAGNGGEGEEVVEEMADGVEVDEEENGEDREENGVEEEEEHGMPLVHPVDRVDLGPVSSSCCRFPHFDGLTRI